MCTEYIYNFPGLDRKAINKCIGDPNADRENPVLKAEQDAQVCTSVPLFPLYTPSVISDRNVTSYTILHRFIFDTAFYIDWQGLSW
jgi:hypothetical protein